jgi:hypothetical protein
MELTHQHGSDVRQGRGRRDQRHDRDPPSVMRKCTLVGPLSGQRPLRPGRWSRRSKPSSQNVCRTSKSLVRRRDVEGLLNTASYKDLAPSSVGTVRDRCSPVRARAVLALGLLAPEAGLPAIRAGLGDPADQVRCAGVRVLHAFTRWVCSHNRCGSCPRTAATPASSLRAPSSISVNQSGRQSWPTRWSNREDDDPLGERDAQLILTLLEGESPSQRMRSSSRLVSLSALSAGSWSTAQRKSRSTRAGKQRGLGRRAPYGVRPCRRGPRPGRIGDPQTPDALAKALEHGDARVRAESAAALAEIQDPAAVKLLLRATRLRAQRPDPGRYGT